MKMLLPSIREPFSVKSHELELKIQNERRYKSVNKQRKNKTIMTFGNEVFSPKINKGKKHNDILSKQY